MNTYQQNFPSAPPINPYQQNTDIIKNFFKRPIILVFAIFSFILPLISFISSLLMSPAANSFLDSYVTNSGANISISFSIPIGSVFLAVCYLLIYIFSKNPHPAKSPSAPFTVLWVLAIISLVISSLIILLLFLFIGVFFLVLYAGASYSYRSYYSFNDSFPQNFPAEAIIPLFLFVICVLLIVFAFMLFYSINNLRYLSSIRKSMHSIYLKKNGAMAFGVINIIFASFCFLLALVSLTGVLGNLTNTPAVFVFSGGLILLALSGTQNLIQGIIAVQYSKYISDITRTLRKDPVSASPYTAPAVNAPYNPAPAPQSENFANPYEAQPGMPPAPSAPMENPYAPQPAENTAPSAAPEINMPDPAPVQEPPANDHVCPNCGASIFKSDMFCNNCGTKLK